MNDRTDRVYKVFNLHPEDRDRIRLLGFGDGMSRHEALLQLVPIVERLDMIDIRESQRRPIRIAIPVELDRVIRERKAATGQPYVQILLEAARRYRLDHPMRGVSNDQE